jgi:hypothetical protein
MAPTLVLFVILLAMPALLHRVALAGHRRVTARRWLALAEESHEDARRGYKTAQLVLTPDGTAASMSGITLGGSYKAEDRARCAIRGCRAPGLDCECGFYAFKDRAEAVELLRATVACNGLRDKALLTVDLEGSVLEYERGYRGERQRVLGVQLERNCARCRDEGVGRRATCLAAARQFRVAPFVRYLTPVAGATSGMLPVRPVCDHHVPERAVVLGLPELAGLLGTEVTWLP